MTGHPRSAHVGLSLVVALALLSGCTSSRPAPIHRDQAVPALRLVAFDNCEELLSGLRAAAREAVGPYGLPGDHVMEDMATDGAKSAVDNAQAAPGAAQDARAPDHSGTNTHEVGVDEPDLVKTDGRRIVTVSRGTLRVVDPTDRRVTGTLSLDRDGPNANLLLAGDHALVLTAGGPLPRPLPWQDAPKPVDPGPDEFYGPRLLLIDLTGTPRVLARYSVEGSLVDARQVGAVARVVVRSSPRLPFNPEGDRAEDQRLADNRRVIDTAPVERWLPRYTVENGDRHSTGRVDCGAVSRPDTYSGTSLLTVLTFDLAASTLGTGNPTSVVADGDTVYANGPSLYVATDQRWRAWPMLRRGVASRVDERTEVYKFDISGAGRPRYVAGGAVPGWLINQYAMSEWNGKLRIATTIGQAGDETRKSESSVYVLDGALKQIGHVGGLGKGERIYAVRFLGPTGYVVTFRQTDPLYVVDLRNPASPSVTGELKINGYSAYLHPAGNGRLIGVGQEADDNGRRKGMQVSLFDVADPARPTRLTQYVVPDGYSEAEFDPHAFLYWPATGLLVVPVTEPNRGVLPSAGALAVRLSGVSINSMGKLDAPRGEQIRRTLIIGDVLWTVSDTTLTAYNAGTLAKLAEL
jgi:uncharacterized secreted protein with C-terminal beta-propeller domain